MISPSKIKVVIVGNQPYANVNLEQGYALGAPTMEPSLSIILKEIIRTEILNEQNPDVDAIKNRYNKIVSEKLFDPLLTSWSEQGVLLINSALTCEEDNPTSHIELWKPFMTGLINAIALHNLELDALTTEPIIFVLMGSNAHFFEKFTHPNLNICFKTIHPGTESYCGNFIGNNLFKNINMQLNRFKKEEIKWI